MTKDTPPNDHAQATARLDDMRRTLGEEAFAALIDKARAELEALSRHPEPWPSALAERGVNVAMLLGLEALERACRAVGDGAQAAGPSPAELAAAAAAGLSDVAAPGRSADDSTQI